MRLTLKQQAGAVRSRLLLALLVSALLHGYFLYQSHDQKTVKPPKPDALTVALAPKAVPPRPTVEPIKPKPKEVKPKPKAKPRTIKPKPKAVSSTPVVNIPETVIPATKKVTEPSIAHPIEAKPEPAWAQKRLEPIDTALPELQETKAVPYLQVNSLYNVYADADAEQKRASRAVLGKATMVYKRNNDRYELYSEVRPSGIMRLFLDDLIQQSHGSVTTQGLQPDYFLYQYDEKKYEARFDWTGRQLKLHSHKGDKTAAMQIGTQDLLSFMFQFMFTSPLSQTGMMVTNGKSVREYRYQFMGEKLVKTEIGVFNTVHIVRDDAVKNEQLSLWLATDYQYLPVKIKKSKPNKNKNYELVIRKLQTDQGEVVGDQASQANEDTTRTEAQNETQQPKAESNTQAPSQPFNPLIQR